MDSIQERRSIRKYKNIPVEKNIIEEIIRAGILAPSAKNKQPWKYIVYSGTSKDELLDEMEKGLQREKNGKAALPDSAHGLPDAFNTLRIMREAPVLIIVLNTCGKSPFESICTDKRVTEICDTLSIGASVENMLLRASELGIGTLWIGNTFFAYNEMVKYIGTTNQLTGAISLGYADEKPMPRPRKDISNIVEYR